jgi:hypothetical protein
MGVRSRGKKEGASSSSVISSCFSVESKAQEAAEAIRNQRERLAHNRTKLQKFNKYFANNDPKKAMGVKSFAEAVQAFGEAEESRDSDDDIQMRPGDINTLFTFPLIRFVCRRRPRSLTPFHYNIVTI